MEFFRLHLADLDLPMVVEAESGVKLAEQLDAARDSDAPFASVRMRYYGSGGIARFQTTEAFVDSRRVVAITPERD